MNKILKIIIFSLIFTSSVYAVNLGSLVKNSYAQIEPENTATFEMLFWNQDESYELQLSIRDKPENFSILIEPEKFILNKNTGTEFISLSNEYVKAMTVDIIVIPDSVNGSYEFSIEANTISDENQVAFSQGRVFRFNLDIGNFEEIQEDIKEIIEEVKEEKPIEETKKENNIFFVILIILLFSAIIYKIA